MDIISLLVLAYTLLVTQRQSKSIDESQLRKVSTN